jgi:hypothetical protein
LQALQLLVRKICCYALQLADTVERRHVNRREGNCCALVVNADGVAGLILVADSGERDGLLEAPLGLQDDLQSQ